MLANGGMAGWRGMWSCQVAEGEIRSFAKRKAARVTTAAVGEQPQVHLTIARIAMEPWQDHNLEIIEIGMCSNHDPEAFEAAPWSLQ
jgi:hypothetical protein